MKLEGIERAVGPKGGLETDNDTLKYRRHWRGRVLGDELLVTRTHSTEALSAAMPITYESDSAVVPPSANTGLVAGSNPTEQRRSIIVLTDRMNKGRDFDTAHFAVVAESGCII